MKRLILFFIPIMALSAVKAQPACADPAVVEIKTELVTDKKSVYDRYRFTVVIKNMGNSAFTASASQEVKMSFISKGYPGRDMAIQPLNNLAPGQSTFLVFEANVTKVTRVLPDWGNMPFPKEVCGTILLGKKTALDDCNAANNVRCSKVEIAQ